MPLRRRRVLVGLLLALLPALGASTARPAAELPLKEVSIGNLSQDSGLPAFTSGVYALSVNGYNCTWNVNVSGSVITGTMICPPATRADGLSGTVVQGTSVTVTRDCSGAFAGCSQTYVATTFEGGMFSGTMTGSGGGGSFTLTPMTPPPDESEDTQPPLVEEEDDTKPPVVKAFPASGQPGKKVRLRFTIDDLYDIADCEVTVFRGARVVGRKGCDHPPGGPRLKWVTWSVPESIHAPAVLRFCVSVWDSAGNEGKRCAKIRLRAA